MFRAAKELIGELLMTDPDKRLTIHQVMKHKWIAVSMQHIAIVVESSK